MYKTDRLDVRQLVPEDAEAMQLVYGDKDAMKYVDDGEAMDLAGCIEWIGITQNNYEKRGYGMSAIAWRATGEVIGFMGIVHPGGQVAAEIKYALKRARWGQGIATEAALGMLRYIHAAFGIAEVIATIDPDNGASRRVLEKAGLTYRDTVTHEDGSRTETLVWRADP